MCWRCTSGHVGATPSAAPRSVPSTTDERPPRWRSVRCGYLALGLDHRQCGHADDQVITSTNSRYSADIDQSDTATPRHNDTTTPGHSHRTHDSLGSPSLFRQRTTTAHAQRVLDSQQIRSYGHASHLIEIGTVMRRVAAPIVIGLLLAAAPSSTAQTHLATPIIPTPRAAALCYECIAPIRRNGAPRSATERVRSPSRAHG